MLLVSIPAKKNRALLSKPDPGARKL